MKKRIAIVTGGDSGEYVISLQSAEIVKKNIDPQRYIPCIVFVSGKKWVYLPENTDKEIAIDKNDFSVVYEGEKITFDAVFLAIHGTPGEDGKLQGYFDLLGIPYTSCGLTTSALTFNKDFCNRVVNSYGIKTASSVLLVKGEPFNVENILKEIGLPCFVKPNNGGSSIGISKVSKPEHLQAAIEKAFHEDAQVLAEAFIQGTEITCGVFRSLGKKYILPLTEIVSKNDFFDFEAKYTPGVADEITPARVSEKIESECKSLASFLYEKLNCRGIVRIDFIYSNGEFYFLEANTIPGLSENSIVPQQAREMGISIMELFTMIIEDTLNRA